MVRQPASLAAPCGFGVGIVRVCRRSLERVMLLQRVKMSLTNSAMGLVLFCGMFGGQARRESLGHVNAAEGLVLSNCQRPSEVGAVGATDNP